MWGVLIIITVVVIVWGILGGSVTTTGSNGNPPNGQETCGTCKGLVSWWYGLTRWQRTFHFVWYWWKRGDCALRGCDV
jgi:hypothetical protein